MPWTVQPPSNVDKKIDDVRNEAGAQENRSAATPESTTIEKVMSGGQTGVDRAVLDVAMDLGTPCGG